MGGVGEFAGQDWAIAAVQAATTYTLCGWHRPQGRVTVTVLGVASAADHQTVWSSSRNRAASASLCGA